MNHNGNRGEPHFNRTKYYGGQFHIGYPGLEEKVVFAMGGCCTTRDHDDPLGFLKMALPP